MTWASTDGITTPAPADIWCQLAAVVSLTELVAAGDFLLSGSRIVNGQGQRTSPLCDLKALSDARKRHRNTLGAPLRHRAIALLRAPVDSPQESFLRLTIIDAGFEEPIVNCPVSTRDRVFHADLGYPQLRIAIEYEGRHHFSGLQQAEFDLHRRRLMAEAGWTVIQVTHKDILDPRAFLRALAAAVSKSRARH
ncbi:hypothetical protein [Leucobacter sp. USHLN153]|uniref:hypothetical protein n=1 Tax=Leucobacter sp. USHLN153 TaxID=3081268 RepID=UPI0030188CF1